MNLNVKAVFLAFGLLGSSIAGASTAGVNLTNETVQGDFNLDMGSFGVNGGVSHEWDIDGHRGRGNGLWVEHGFDGAFSKRNRAQGIAAPTDPRHWRKCHIAIQRMARAVRINRARSSPLAP